MKANWGEIFRIIGEFLKKILTVQGTPVWVKIVVYVLLAVIAILGLFIL